MHQHQKRDRGADGTTVHHATFSNEKKKRQRELELGHVYSTNSFPVGIAEAVRGLSLVLRERRLRWRECHCAVFALMPAVSRTAAQR